VIKRAKSLVLREELRRRAARLARKYCPDGPPFDPFKIARLLNVQVKIEDIGELDGFVEYRNAQYVAVLSARTNSSRRRFTLGHELCHMLLMEDARQGRQVNLTRYRASVGAQLHQDPEEEALCNSFASELLMPSGDVREVIAGHSQISCELIQQICSVFDVSFHAAGTVLVKIFGQKVSGASLWRSHEHPRWPLAIWSVGLRPHTRAQMRLIECLVAATNKSGEQLSRRISSAGRSDSCIEAQSMPAAGNFVLLTFVRLDRLTAKPLCVPAQFTVGARYESEPLQRSTDSLPRASNNECQQLALFSGCEMTCVSQG
jgi:Zn-dependent peptidase ImmA (M78 family)